MSVLEKLTEGIVDRDLQKEGAALLSKWEATGLLEGLEGDSRRHGMARLLENQAKQLLKEASSMQAGDVEGFAAVAFPIVRRVFGGLIANDLVSVQPMSLPSGLIFFLDFTYQQDERLGLDAGDSVYGGGKVAKGIQAGLTDLTEQGGGFYNLANAYSSATGSIALTEAADVDPYNVISAGEIADEIASGMALTTAGTAVSALSEAQKKAIRFDPDILSGTSSNLVSVMVVRLSDADMANINKDMLSAISVTNGAGDGAAEDTFGGATLIRRLTELGVRNSSGSAEVESSSKDNYISLYMTSPTGTTVELASSAPVLRIPLVDDFTNGAALGSVVGQDSWGLEEPRPQTGNAGDTVGKNVIPEILRSIV